MKLTDIFENFGLTGIRKDNLNRFLQRGIIETLLAMSATHELKMVTSISKRMIDPLMGKMFHIRNVVNGKEKYLERKLLHYVAPSVRSGVKSVTVDHPELKDSRLDSEEFVENFIEWLVDNVESFKKVIS